MQLDSIINVTRAHHHILWSRNKKYKDNILDDLLFEKGKVFEYFTHDASILPFEFYYMWKSKFKNTKEKFDKSSYYNVALDKNNIKDISRKIKKEGALNTKDFDSKIEGEKKMWSITPHKITLDYMWHSGLLVTAYRKKYRKYFDLAENIIPSAILNKSISKEDKIYYFCTQALDKMSIASPNEIKDFWDALSIKEVNTWIKKKNNLLKVLWENNEGKYIKIYACSDIQNRLNNLKNSKKTIQLINPFDQLIRDRKRLKSIFDFDYKIEIFVPKGKRVWDIMFILY